MSQLNSLASVLRSARMERGWTQGHAAARCGISTRGYQLIEKGERTDTSLFVLTRISRGFGVLVVVGPDGVSFVQHGEEVAA